MNVRLNRFFQVDGGTIGRLYVDGQFVCYSVELPWKGNQRNVSCIPEGDYPLIWDNSPRFGRRLHVECVKDRSHILVHEGNYQRDIRGCILPVTKFQLASDGCCGWNSRVALAKLSKLLPDDGEHYRIEVRNPPEEPL